MPLENTVKDQKIIIDLNETDTKGFETNNFIQVQARDKLFILIKKFVDQRPEKLDDFERVHHTILIQGKRGSGKTSFILSVKKQIEDGFKNLNLDAPTPDKLVILNIIDPTLIESKEHVFINIITRIKERVEEAIKDKNELVYKNWKSSLIKLAGGLSMLDGVGSEHLKDNLWDSPELSLEKGLSNSKHGYKLEENFKNFVHQSLQVLNQKAFVLILDDIDTSLNEGRLILETIRKYLTTPQLITILLGDIELYSTLVRQLQWEKIDPKHTLEKYELEYGREHYLGQIEHLEEQYLTKILMPENRIILQSLKELSELEKQSEKVINIKIDVDRQIPLSDYVIQFINDAIGINKHFLVMHYYDYLLAQPVRSVLQILNAWQKYGLSEEFLFVSQQTFFTSLRKKLQNNPLLSINNSQVIYNLISIYMIRNGINKSTHFKFLPDHLNDDDNALSMYISIMTYFQINNSQYLSYFIKIGYVLESLSTYDRTEYESFIDFISLTSSISNTDLSRRILATSTEIQTNTRQNPILFGSVFISNQKLNQIQDATNLSPWLCKINGSKLRGSYHFFSFMHLLGVLADLSEADGSKYEDILERTNQILEFILFRDKTSMQVLEQSVDTISFGITDEIKIKLDEWISKKKNVDKLPLNVLANIWIRLSYTFENIRQIKNNYYEIIELFIAGFLNAVLVEISIYNNEVKKFKNSTIFLNNPRSSASDYLDKYNEYSVIKDRKNYTFFDYLVECPLLDLALYASLKSVKFKIDFMRLTEEEQKELIEGVVKEYKITKPVLSNYKTLTDTQKDNFITSRFRNRLPEYENIQKNKIVSLLELE